MNQLSALPQTEIILQHPDIEAWFAKIGRPLVLNIVREVLEYAREELKKLHAKEEYTGGAVSVVSTEKLTSRIVERVDRKCRSLYQKRIRKVINATGIILNTNMGRSPISLKEWDAVKEVNCGYSNLELDLSTGKRGKRGGLCSLLLAQATGGETGLVVNNNAAALFLLLTVLSRGKEVIISRGEQVQIGGGFRIPDILRRSGAVIKEVGTTNITTAQDYLNGVTEHTAMVLLVHRSNFTIRGFSASPDLRELAVKLPKHIPLVVDQGSGAIREDIPGEQKVAQHLKRGAHLVCFSGDKILGTVQAGCIVGKKRYIDQLAGHPLYRILRPGKTVLALLEEHLVRYVNQEQPFSVDVLQTPADTIKKRVRRITKGLKSENISVADSSISTGGGSAPDEYHHIPRGAVSIRAPQGAAIILEKLRNCPVPIIGTISQGEVILHGATIDDNDIPYVRERVMEIISDIDRHEAEK